MTYTVRIESCARLYSAHTCALPGADLQRYRGRALCKERNVRKILSEAPIWHTVLRI